MELLKESWRTTRSLLCVGLDPDLNKLPTHLKNTANSIFEFNKAIIDATADLACVYKPQMAYYSGQGCEDQLKQTLQYLKANYKQIPVILDAKRGDIGETASMYAKEAFEIYGADAVTVNPYMGSDTLQPFLDYKNKGVIVLCKTSNKGSSDFQNLQTSQGKIFETVARKAATDWNGNGNVSLVVGATYVDEIKRVRELVGDMPLLVPGVGAQGGDLAQVLRYGRNKQGAGLMINASRSIIYASSGKDFAQAAREAAVAMVQEMRK